MCVEMNKNGIWIDQKKRFELEVEYEHSVIQREKRIRELGDDLSPGSYDQIRHLLYEKWKLPIPPTMDAREFYTDTGLPGTDDNVLRAHMAGGLLSEKQSAFIRELRLFRREKNKILGTVLIPLRTREEDPKKGLVWEDGRVQELLERPCHKRRSPLQQRSQPAEHRQPEGPGQTQVCLRRTTGTHLRGC
jgi:hypothetical protein